MTNRSSANEVVTFGGRDAGVPGTGGHRVADHTFRLRLVTPVYDDWESFRLLLQELDKFAATSSFRIFVTAVNDGSIESPDSVLNDISEPSHLYGAEILHLSVNVGHQRAIAIGLCVASQDDSADAVLIMDADGEDPPEAIALLTQGIGEESDFCFVAQRQKRTEKLSFKLSYMVYKAAFRLVTGKKISFGNFSVFSRGFVRRLVMVSDLWNNLPAAALRSRLPIKEIPIDRGKRYTGKSKMNFTSLIVHGLSGISVYADTIFVRLLLLTIFLVVLAFGSISLVFVLRLFFPAHATPGWATTVTFGMVIILLQVLFTTLSSILMLLNNRVQRLVVPIKDYVPYVDYREMLFGSRFPASKGAVSENALGKREALAGIL
jgi:glycosyltransferase involved in cell wall biosynthesis